MMRFFSNKLTISLNKMLRLTMILHFHYCLRIISSLKLLDLIFTCMYVIILLASLKYISLVTLTVQNAALILWLRYVRTREGDMFLSATAVVMAELIKCFISLSIILYQVRKK